MFDMFKDNDEIVAAILASIEIEKCEICGTLNDLRSRIVGAWSYYNEAIKEERRKQLAETKERYNEISKLSSNI